MGEQPNSHHPIFTQPTPGKEGRYRRPVSTDYVYVMQFDGEKIMHMTKIWNSEFGTEAGRLGLISHSDETLRPTATRNNLAPEIVSLF